MLIEQKSTEEAVK